MWRDLITAIDPDAVCHPSASADQITQLEALIGVTVPSELNSFLREMNGADVMFGLSFMWSAEEIVQRNLEMRREWRPGGNLESFMPVDHLLFFGEAGNGDLYGFPVTPEGVRSEVFLWDHENDSRTYQAKRLSDWLQRK